MKKRTALLSTPKLIAIRTLLCFLLFLSFTPTIALSQNSSEAQPLIQVLKQLEKKFEVKFSYHRRSIKNINIESSTLAPTLEENLIYLTNNTSLSFTRIDSRYIAVVLVDAPTISVCGILIDQNKGTPISGASIITNDITTTTDSGGNFQISNVPENAKITIVYLDTEIETIRSKDLIQAEKCPFIYVTRTVNFLPVVILNDYITKGITKNAEGDITITNKNFDILPSLIEPDILQIAQALPGIESADETAANLNVRGGNTDEFLILWEDVRMYQSGHFFGLISAFNPNLTKEVTILKNATWARFGEGVSGVIAMSSDDHIPEEVSGGVGINLTSTSGFAKIPASEKFSFAVSGRSSLNTGIGNPVYNEFFSKVFQNTVITNLQTNVSDGLRSTDEAFNFYDVSIRALWDIGRRDKIRYDFLAIDNKLNFTERFIEETNPRASLSELEQRNIVNGISWNRRWLKRSGLSTNIFFYTTNYFQDEFTQDIDLDRIQSTKNEVGEKGLKTDVSYKVNDKVILSGGYHYIETEVIDSDKDEANSIVSQIRNVSFANAYFLNAYLKLFKSKTVVLAGIRYNDYPSLSANFLEPRLHITQKITPNFSLNLAGEFKNQSIFQFTDVQDNLLGIENKKWLIASDENAILESKQLSLGGAFSRNNWSISLDGFVKNVSGISSANQGFRNQLQNSNFSGEYQVKGIEFSIGKKVENWNAWVSYTFQDNDYEFQAFTPTSFRNNLDIKHSLTLAATYSVKNFTFSLGNTYKSGLPFTTPVAGNEIVFDEGVPTINFNDPNNETLDGYFRSDFSAVYKFTIDDTFSARVNTAFLNILNRKNTLDTYYILDTLDPDNPTLNRIEQFSLGFTPNISFQLLF